MEPSVEDCMGETRGDGMSAKIEPCPCGAVPGLLWGTSTTRDEEGRAEHDWVLCSKCRMSGPAASSPEKALASWNRIAAAVRERDQARALLERIHDTDLGHPHSWRDCSCELAALLRRLEGRDD